jgi:hypothetical protein
MVAPSSPPAPLRLASPALLLCALALPFLGKAFTIDDVTFLLQARHVLSDPLHPTAFTLVFHGDPLRLSSALVSGPGMAYLLVPAVLSGHAEVVAHLLQLALLAAGAVATASLGLRLGLDGPGARMAALLLCACPTVLGMAGTAMPDVPAMSLGALGLDRLCAFGDRLRDGAPRAAALRAGLAAALLLALAALFRTHLLLLLPIGWALLHRDTPAPALRHTWPRTLWPLALSLLLLACVNVITRDPAQGHDLARTTLGRMALPNLPRNAGSLAAHWVLHLPLGLLWLALRRRRLLQGRGHRIALGLGALLALGLKQDPWVLCLALAPVTALGTLVLWDIVSLGWERAARSARAVPPGDRVPLILGLWLLIPLPTVWYEHLPPKYLLAAAPAMALLLALHLREARARWAGPAAIACGAALGVLILKADGMQAEIGRMGGQIAAEEVAAQVKVGGGGQVWLDGAWGFQWYAMEAGARPMTKGPPYPAPGDVVVQGPEGGRVVACRRIPTRRLIRKEGGGRVIGHGAGFFSNGHGVLPWSFAPSRSGEAPELGRIEVWSVQGCP